MIIKTLNEKVFDGAPVTIVAGGSSLIGFDYSRVRHPIIAINSSIEKVPDADVFLALDRRMFTCRKQFLRKFQGLQISEKRRDIGKAGIVNWAFHEIEYNILQEPDFTIQKGNLSGFTAIGVAFLLGAKRIYLLGYDGGFDEGQLRNHYDIPSQIQEDTYSRKNDLYSIFAEWPIINVGLGSKITAFKKVDLNSNFYKYK